MFSFNFISKNLKGEKEIEMNEKKNLTTKETFTLAVQHQQKNNLRVAEKLYKEILKINPNHANTYNNLGSVLKKLGESRKAISYFQKTIQINPNHADAHYNLGIVFKDTEEYQKAINCYERAIQINPNLADAYNNLGNTLKELGKIESAINCYRKALEHDPENLTYYYHLNDFENKILDSNLKNRINKILNNINSTKNNLAYGNLLLSRYEMQTKNYKKEFDYLLRGHQYYFESKEKKFKKEVEYSLNKLPKVKELFTFNKSANDIKNVNYNIKPIFIIGVPRCGSTLVEKIIASGTKYIPIGEETGIFSAFVKQKINQKQSVFSDIEVSQTKIFEKYKQKRLIQETSDYTFTDKSLDNFFYISLIKEIFPHAKVINCKRNVLSSIMSIFQNNLISIEWAHNLEYIFEYFNIYYKITKNFNKTLPNFIYELEYEKFVNDPENESKKLFEFCDLPWDKKCLEFYKREDLISKTASNIQIREAIYKHSMEKYLPYKNFLNKYGKKYSWFN